jgi:zinc protease
MALRVFPVLLYGKNHAYGTPFTGSGYADTVAPLTRDDLVAFKMKWLGPNNARMIVVGDTTLDEIKPKIENMFKSWAQITPPKKDLARVAPPAKSRIYLINRPGAQQSVIIAGHTAPPRSDPKEIAIDMMNQILGGSFTSRVNMNLREDKHWSYGAMSTILDSQGERPFLLYAAVQSDKTKESVSEILKEMKGLIGDKPITADEHTKVRKNKVLELPGRWETMGAVQNSVNEILRFALPDNYYEAYPEAVKAQTQSDLSQAAKNMLKPDHVIWVVVGDAEEVGPKLKALGWGDIEMAEIR